MEETDEEAIREIIAEAVAAEREACAKIAQKYADQYERTEDAECVYFIPAAIRARGKEKQPATFLMDGNEHTKGKDCHCSPKICRKNGCDGYLHREPIYGPSFMFQCEKCETEEKQP
jgi:hypothetical protein